MPKTTIMKKILIIIAISIVSIVSPSFAQKQPVTYFPYPEVPQDLTTLSERSDYLISHFWDKCNISEAFRQKDDMNQAFRDFISFMPYATATTVNDAVARLIKSVKKPGDLLMLAEMAEDALYGENASFWSDEIYLPFAKAAAAHKKIAKASRERFSRQVKCIERSGEGQPCPDSPITLADGSKTSVKKLLTTTAVNILFFNNPDCDDCAMVRLNFETDLNVSQLIADGKIKLISISPAEPDDEWRNAIRGYSSDWTAAASLSIDDDFDLRVTPCFYIIDSQGVIVAKNKSLPQTLSFTKQLAETR